MAKRRRRRAVVLESDEDEADGPAKLSEVLSTTAMQEGKKLEMISERKLQKSSRQRTVDNLFDASRAISNKKRLSRTLPLEVITQPATDVQGGCKRRKGRASAALEDTLPNGHKLTLAQHVDHRSWVDKYSPKSMGELVVHSRKVAEVKDWLQGQLLNPFGTHGISRVLILTGPAGVGKTAVVHVLAELMEIDLLEWTTPTPELWQEYRHHGASGSSYVSKLDEFEAFLERARKMSSLPIVSVGMSSAQQVRPFSGDDRSTSAKKGMKLLFIDDLPVVNNRDNHHRLGRSFYHLALSQSFPAIVVITDEAAAGDRPGEREHVYKGVIEALERGGAKKIAFNPITTNAMKKLLSKVQVLEKCRISSESLSALAESSAGDIRQALNSLQFLSLGCHSHTMYHLMWDPGGFDGSLNDPKKLRTNGTKGVSSKNKELYASAVGRDCSLSLFHALGKFLHNKRHTDVPVLSGEGMGFVLKEELRRHPLNMEEPEAIIAQAHSEAGTILAFLHENVLQFVDEDATDDVAAILAYFSDTDFLLGAQGNLHSRHALINSNDVYFSQISTAAANSVASRGVLFANGHPAPRRWQSLRAPVCWQAERQRRKREVEASTQHLQGIFETGALCGPLQVMELLPCRQQLSRRMSLKVPTKVFDIVETDDVENMDLDVFERQDPTSVSSTDLEDITQGHSTFESTFSSTFSQMCVEDEIEDP